MSLVEKAQNYTSSLLNKCANYPYHNPAHTTWVFNRATYLALAENVTGEDLEDLQLASLFHDTGFIEQYEKNEHIGARIARKWLIENHHPEERIEKVESIIMATVLFSVPHTLLEEIIQDADLDNIGTREEFYFSLDYYDELKLIGKADIPDCAYWQFVFTLLTKYKFHTETAKRERHEQQMKDIDHMEKFLPMLGCEVPRKEMHTMHAL